MSYNNASSVPVRQPPPRVHTTQAFSPRVPNVVISPGVATGTTMPSYVTMPRYQQPNSTITSPHQNLQFHDQPPPPQPTSQPMTYATIPSQTQIPHGQPYP